MTHLSIQRLIISLTSGFALIAALSTPALAGPWVKSPGESYLKVSGSTFSSDQAFDLDGNLVDSGYKASQKGLGIYGEVGIFPGVALNFNTAFYSSTNAPTPRVRYKNQGPGDLDVSLQVALLRGACAASISPGARFPLYSGTVGSEDELIAVDGETAGIQRYTPALGDGSVDLVVHGSYGCSLHPIPGWFGVQAGPRVRLNGFGDGVDYAADVGVFVWPKRVAITVRANGIQTLTGNNKRPTKSYISVGAGLIANIYAGFALEANASYIPTGEFIAQGWTGTVGLSYSGDIFDNPYK